MSSLALRRLARTALGDIPAARFGSRSSVAGFACAASRSSAHHRPESSIDTKDSSSEHYGQHGKRKGRSVAVPALAFFGVALPLGWCLKIRLQQGNNTLFAQPTEFVKYKLIGKDNVSSTCAIFRLRPAGNKVIDLDDPEKERAITSVEFKQPQLQIARSYTCLPQQDGQPADEMRFLIRREEKGEVSNYLHRLPIGTDIEVRGLHSEYDLPRDVKSVIFLVGGTGIAPAMQIADALEGSANVHILWANRRREDCIGGQNDSVTNKARWKWWSSATSATDAFAQHFAAAEKGALVTILESVKSRSAAFNGGIPRVKVDYYIDEEGTYIQKQDLKSLISTHNDHNVAGKNFLFVSGPPGFIAHWAGPKRWANGTEVQGPLAGILSAFDLKEWVVVKL